MTDATEINDDRIRARQRHEDTNVFSRLPAVYSASRAQAQRLLLVCGGLSIVEWRTLWDLAEVGPMTIGDLAAIQRADHSQLSRALPEMRRKKYVTTRRDPRDGRQTIVALAPAGRATYEMAAPIMARRRALLREKFSEVEIQTLIELLERLDDIVRIPAEQIADESPQ